MTHFIQQHAEAIGATIKVWGLQISTSLFITLIDAKSIVTIIVTVITGGLSAGYTIWKWRNEMKDKNER